MKIRKLLLFIGLFVFFMSFNSSSFALSFIPEEDDISVEDNNKAESKEEKTISSELKKAKKYYFRGNFAKADGILDKIIEEEPLNESAIELQNKIALLTERENEYKKNLIDDYFIELRKTVIDGNIYEGFMYIKKINDLSEDENLSYFTNVLNMEKDAFLEKIENDSDKEIFLKSLDAFVDEDFDKSVNLLFKLQDKYPHFSYFLSVSRAKSFEENNVERMQSLYKDVIKNLKQNNFVLAKNYAQQLYMLDYRNVKSRVLLDQIDLEIE